MHYFNIIIQNLRRLSLVVSFFLFPLFFSGQSLTGLWSGAITQDSTSARKDQSFEIALTEYKGKVYGYSCSEFIVNDTLYYIVKRVKGEIKDSICEVKDDEIIAYNFRGKLDKGVKVTSTFRRNKNDSNWYLDGSWKTNATKKYYGITGKVKLAEEKDLSLSKVFPHLEELNLANEIAFYKERTKEPVIAKLAKPERINIVYESPKNLEQQSSTTVAVPQIKQATADASIVASVQADAIAAGIQKPDNDLQKTQKSITNSTTANVPSVSNPDLKQANADMELVAAVQADAAIAAIKKPIDENNKTNTRPVASSNNELKQTIAAKPTPTQSFNKPANQQQAIVMNTKPQTNTEVKPVNNKAQQNTVATHNPASTKTTAPQSEKNMPTISLPANEIVRSQAETISTIIKTDAEVAASGLTIAERKSEFKQVVHFKSDSLLLALYDNGEIDGDTVSVFMNGAPLLIKQGLKAYAIKKTIYIGKDNEDFNLVLYADNLGLYPPNTGLLVVRDGDDIYNIRFSSDLQKSSGVVFRKKRN